MDLSRLEQKQHQQLASSMATSISGGAAATASAKSSKLGRKRAKFIRKVKCAVCGDLANDHIHYGATTCYSCRAFFRRSVTSGAKYVCSKSGNCEVNRETRKQCQACRLAKCYNNGMKPSWVMTEDEKVEKKEAAQAKKRIKMMGNPVDPTTLPKSSYLKKRAVEGSGLKRRSRRASSRSSNSETSTRLSERFEGHEGHEVELGSVSPGMSSGDYHTLSPHHISGHHSGMSPHDLSIHPRMSPGHQQHSTMSPGAIGRYSPGLGDGNGMLYHPRASPHHYGNRGSPSPSAYHQLIPVEEAVPRDISVGFTTQEEAIVHRLVGLEAQSRELIPISQKTMEGIVESIQTGCPLSFEVAKEGYNTAVQRIAQFISRVEAFNTFDIEDRKALIGNNCHMVVRKFEKLFFVVALTLTHVS